MRCESYSCWKSQVSKKKWRERESTGELRTEDSEWNARKLHPDYTLCIYSKDKGRKRREEKRREEKRRVTHTKEGGGRAVKKERVRVLYCTVLLFESLVAAVGANAAWGCLKLLEGEIVYRTIAESRERQCLVFAVRSPGPNHITSSTRLSLTLFLPLPCLCLCVCVLFYKRTRSDGCTWLMRSTRPSFYFLFPKRQAGRQERRDGLNRISRCVPFSTEFDSFSFLFLFVSSLL